MKNQLQLIAILICTLLFTQCRKDEIITEIDSTPVIENATDVLFLTHIKDKDGVAIPDATLTILKTGENIKSDKNGVVQFYLASIAFTGESITIKHLAYSSLTKTVTGATNSHNKIDIVLTKAASKLINTGEIGSIGDGNLSLPNALLLENGSSYSGPVTVKYTYLDPDNTDFLDAAPGNLLALNNDSEYQQLASLGMYSIELYDEQNNSLSIPSDSTATIAFPVADIHKGTVLDEVPLWYFDENQGLWIEDGKATLSGEMMIAEVSHFTWWNCDLTYDFTPLCMSFVDEAEEVLSGVEIYFSVDDATYGNAYTDENGSILTKTPIGEIVTISYYLDGELLGVQDIGPFDESSNKPIVTLSTDISIVSGNAIDCTMNNVENGYGILDINGVNKVFPINNGAFSFGINQIGDFVITFYNVVSGKTKIETVSVIDIDADILLGSIVLCEESLMSGISGVVMKDTDNDGEADAPAPGEIIRIWGDAEVEITTNDDGIYEVFLPPGNYNIIHFVDGPNVNTRYGIDSTDDGDEDDGRRGKTLDCVITVDEIDDGNDFFILPPENSTITGRVLIDNDGDGIGDEPLVIGSVRFSIPGEASFQTDLDEDGKFRIGILNSVLDGTLSLTGSGITFISDYDESPDPEGDDSSDGPNGIIPIELSFNEDDSDNNFVIRQLERGTVSGRVMEDTNGDGLGDMPVMGVGIRINTPLSPEFPKETLTDADGYYEFINLLVPHQYKLSIDDSNFTSISDYDESPDPDGDDGGEGANNSIPVDLEEGEIDADNNFVVVKVLTGTISGRVLEDTDNDDVGDAPIAGLGINLRDASSTILASVTSDDNGYYEFTDITPGDYLLTEQPETVVDDDFVDVYDGDDTPEDANDAVDGLNDDRISVTLEQGENDSDNNFIEEQLGSISGTSLLDTNNDDIGDVPVVGLEITLTHVGSGVSIITTTDGNGNYKFESLEPGEYTVTFQDESEIDPSWVDVFDGDESDDGDASDSIIDQDDMIFVSLVPGEDDENNNSVDRSN